jgi:phosphoribosyl 1,2-cyclic phosphodiesterase
MRFISFGSGSSGNCYFIGDENYGILIDAGLSSRKTKKYLKEVGMI